MILFWNEIQWKNKWSLHPHTRLHTIFWIFFINNLIAFLTGFTLIFPFKNIKFQFLCPSTSNMNEVVKSNKLDFLFRFSEKILINKKCSVYSNTYEVSPHFQGFQEYWTIINKNKLTGNFQVPRQNVFHRKCFNECFHSWETFLYKSSKIELHDILSINMQTLELCDMNL